MGLGDGIFRGAKNSGRVTKGSKEFWTRREEGGKNFWTRREGGAENFLI